MAEDSDLERTEPASARRLEQAREKGDVPRSRELATLAVLLSSTAVMAFLGVTMFHGLSDVMSSSLTFDQRDIDSPTMMGRNLMEAGMEGVMLLMPLAATVVVAALASNVMVSGWVFSTQANFVKNNCTQDNVRNFYIEIFYKNGIISDKNIF